MAIQLVENVHCHKNIDLVDQSVKETLLKMLEMRQTNMKPVQLLVRLPLVREVGCISNCGKSGDAN
ncbi:hypothetical protein J1N35_026872 [Gossypium stocksii]|uniref:Uncharacterized protein n=1 Tax=Gossypium stocksii TaxID=47602 RepID=A0A9D3V9A3_9ROSI|nr:hypothetical protein J1N35_026872 [Gossypium stocksii]